MSDWSETAFGQLTDLLVRFELQLRAIDTARTDALHAEEERLREASRNSRALTAIACWIEEAILVERHRLLAEGGLRIEKVGILLGGSQPTLHDPAPASFRIFDPYDALRAAGWILTFEVLPGAVIRSRVTEARSAGSSGDGEGLANTLRLADLEARGPHFVREAFRRAVAVLPAPNRPA